MLCPSCPANPLALFICDDGVHRCYQCKTKNRLSRTFPIHIQVVKDAPAVAQAAPAQSEHTAITHAKAAIRNRLTRIEAVSGWDKSPWNCGKHEGLSEALEILKGVAK